MLLQRKHQTIINASRMLVVFCKPMLQLMLAMLLQRKRLIAHKRVCCDVVIKKASDHSQACFVNPCLQYCYKENV